MPASLSAKIIEIARRHTIDLGLPPEPFDHDINNRAYWVVGAVIHDLGKDREPYRLTHSKLTASIPILDNILPTGWRPDVPLDSKESAGLWLKHLRHEMCRRIKRHPFIAYLREVAILADEEAVNKAQSIAPSRFNQGDLLSGRVTDGGQEIVPGPVTLLLHRVLSKDKKRAVAGFPAQVNERGQLFPMGLEETPQIHIYRLSLHSPEGAVAVVLDEAQLEKSESTLLNGGDEGGWTGYARQALELITAALGVPIEDAGMLWEAGSAPLKWSCVRTEEIETSGLATIYQEIGARQSLPPLLKAWQDGRQPKQISMDSIDPSLHLAHMDAWNPVEAKVEAFSLDRTQRLAAIAASQIKPTDVGEVVPVNGPPGTGKTSFLRSVIASYWVADALSGLECPRLIVGTGATNKSVSNVIEAFSGVAAPPGNGWRSRWLQGLPSYGWFMPSSKAKKDYPHLMWLESAAEGHFSAAGAADGVSSQNPVDMQAYYLTQAKAHLGTERALDLDEALNSLLQEMRKWERWMQQVRANAYKQLGNIRSVRGRILKFGPRPVRSLTLAIQSAQQVRMQAQHALDVALARRRQAENLFRAWANYAGGWRIFIPEFLRRPLMPARYLVYQKLIHLLPPGQDAASWFAACTTHNEETELQKADDRVQELQASLNQVKKLRIDLAIKMQQFPKQLPEELRPDFTLLQVARAVRRNAAFNEKAEARFDEIARFRLFHLAARYWEGKWIKRQLASVQDKRDSFDASTWMMLAPIIVATTKKLQGILKSIGSPHVLIIDEAGQCATHLGMFLAEKAANSILVGDTLQLEPVFPISHPQSVKLAVVTNGPKDGWPDAVCASRGSMMTVAQRAASVTDSSPQPGIELQYHYRCHPDIMEYCNNLKYGGRMINRVRVTSPDSLKNNHLLWLPIPGKPSRVGKSWRNDDEIEAIARYVETYHARLCDKYGKPLQEVLAVITPLQAQSNALKQILPRRLAKSVSAEALEKTTVGTVHSLQGAERPVVLFSLVQHGGYFADSSDGRLMNVAVSRAKNQFILFGDPGVNSSGKNPVARFAVRATRHNVKL